MGSDRYHEINYSKIGDYSYLISVMSALDAVTGERGLEWIDFRKFGINEEIFTAWWNDYKQAEAIRKEREREKQYAKEQVLSKLTEDERKILGV